MLVHFPVNHQNEKVPTNVEAQKQRLRFDLSS